jgi:hypothetical protein
MNTHSAHDEKAGGRFNAGPVFIMFSFVFKYLFFLSFPELPRFTPRIDNKFDNLETQLGIVSRVLG